MEIWVVMVLLLVPAAYLYGLIERHLNRQDARDQTVAQRLRRLCCKAKPDA